jgi:hypothetical protein
MGIEPYELTVCQRCFAVLDVHYIDDHAEWHQRISGKIQSAGTPAAALFGEQIEV